jgi:histidinol-phosphate phosphatase family protein
VFLDRDGTVARDAHYCRRPEDFEILPTVPEAVRLLNENGFKVVVVTNQSGMARGYFDEEGLSLIHRKMTGELARSGARIDAVYYCPHHPDAGCACRKPRTALFDRAALELNIDLRQSFVVGDTYMDIKAGQSIGARTVLVTAGPDGSGFYAPGFVSGNPQHRTLYSEPWTLNRENSPPDLVASDMLTAASLIVQHCPPLASVIIPAYNEELGLPIVLEKIFEVVDSSYEVIVVDDGSTDGTAEVAARFPCRIIRHEVNRGKGAGILTGAECARSENLIYIDADDTYPPTAIPTIAEALRQYDMVMGSRRYGQENIPTFNRFGNFVLRNVIRTIYHFKPYDPLTGLWGIKKGCLLVCSPTVRFAPDAQICMKAARMKLRMFDVPITYTPRVGRTKLPPVRAGLEHLRLIISLLYWTPNARASKSRASH